MKHKQHIFKLLFAAIGLFALGACSDYFDVRPKSQVLAEELFENEQGFNDQLVGVYKRMASSALYSKEMSFGLMEALSQNYDLPVGSPYEEAARYNYRNMSVQNSIDSIWSEMYTAIANLNILLGYIDDKQSVFTEDNYRIYKGEALGLRAFLHFDLLRIFAPAYTSGSSAPAIPYVTEYTTAVTPQSTVAEVTEAAIKDLTEAMQLLEADPLMTSDTNNAYKHRSTRTYRFNYYAAAATLARIYQWRGTAADMSQALKYARIVLEEKKFAWIHYTSITSQNTYDRDLLFSSELVFRMNVTDMNDLIKPYFHASSDATQKLSPSEIKWQEIYEVNTQGYGQDWRHTYHWQNESGEAWLAKYWQYDGSTYRNWMPVIRLAEMYYIAAEACLTTDPKQAVRYLNTVRENRYLGEFDLDENLPADQIREEIYKEYRKELIGEGQLFYYYKRMGYTRIPGSAVNANDQVYVLPMPENEVEFGKR